MKVPKSTSKAFLPVESSKPTKLKILGDRPMSEGGKGRPVDDLDVTCQHYKQCQKCARMAHGEVSSIFVCSKPTFA